MSRAGLEPSPEAIPRTQAELLTEQFYRWERRGRGWQVWDFPVALEPPFVPFRFHWIPPESADDGRRPTFLSSTADRLLGLLGRGQRQHGLSVPELEVPVPKETAGSSDRKELEISMPMDADFSPEDVEHFLLALPRDAGPIAFEVTGTSEATRIQLACASERVKSIRSQFQAHIPRVSITQGEPLLEQAWGPGESREAAVIDCGLSEEFMLPLKTFRRFAIDPLSAVCAALSDLSQGECGVLQVLFEPVRHPWARSILKAVLDDAGGPFFLDAPEIVPRAKEKVSRTLYACVIRVAGKGETIARSHEIARHLGWTLNSLTDPTSNRLIPLSNESYPDDLHAEDLLLRRTRRSGMVLSASELVSLVHPPTSAVRAAKLVRSTRTTNAAPAIASGHAYVLGTNEHAGKAAEVTLSEDQRSRHVYIVGASGTGKSTLLLNLILQDLQAGRGLALLDPHGELVDEILRRCPKDRAQDVVLLDPADSEFPIGFNILSAHSELERTLLSSDLVSVFRRLSTSWGDQMTSVLGNAILAFLESDRGGTLLDLRRFLVEGEFRKEYLKSVRDPEVVYYWQREFPLLAGKPQAPLLTRLDTFLRPKTIRYMVAQKESRLDLRKLMDSGGVLLARLSQGAIGEENAYLLGTLLTAKLNQIATSRQEVAASERRPFYLYVDEFHNFVTPSMEQILSGARKYRLGLVLAHQELQQIRTRSPEVLSSVLSNPYTRVCFRVGEQDARMLSEGFVHFGARDLQSLGTGEAIGRVERSEFDFNLRTVPLERNSGDGVRNEVMVQTRAEYGRPRAEIEAMLAVQGEKRSSDATVGHPTTSGPRRPTPPPDSVGPPTASTVRRQETGTSVSASDQNPLRDRALTQPSAGRGGAQHKYLQELVRQWAGANGWRAEIEEPVLSRLGNVDVALRKGERSIAVEIGVTTDCQHEIGNVQKCLAAGFDPVLAVISDKRILAEIRRQASESFTPEQLLVVQFCSPDEMIAALDGLEAHSTGRERTVRGYRVKVRINTQGAADRTRGAVSRVIANAIRRLRRS